MDIEQNKDLQSLHTFGVPWSTQHFVVASGRDEVRDAVVFAQTHETPLMVLGGGSNILPTKTFEGLVLHNQIMGREVVDQNDQYTTIRVGAGEDWHELVTWCVEQGYYGIENLALIPGTVGGAVVQNIGAYDVDIAQRVVEVEAIDLKTGEERILSKDECELDYRHSIFKGNNTYCVTSVTLQLDREYNSVLTYRSLQERVGENPTAQQVFDEIVQLRTDKLPDWNTIGTAGSFFGNPRIGDEQVEMLKEQYPNMPVFDNYGTGENTIPAGWLIEHSSLPSEIRQKFLYDKHHLIVVNKHKPTGDTPADYGPQIKEAVDTIQQAVKQDFDIQLDPEVLIL